MPIKILQVITSSESLPYLLNDHISKMKSTGIKIFLACSQGAEFNEFISQHQIRPIYLEIDRKINPIDDIRATIKLIKFIRKEKVDFVIGHTPKAAFIAMMSSWLIKVPNRIYVRHGLIYETMKGIKREIFINIERLTCVFSNKIINVSPSLINISKKHKLNKDSKNIILNYGTLNGIDYEEVFNPLSNVFKSHKITSIDQDKYIYGFIGRLSKDKGLYELICAWKLFIKEVQDVLLIIIGENDIRDSVSDELIQYLIIEPTIIYISRDNNVNMYYRIMNVFILPSFREGLPTVVLEASSMELPIITTRATGCIDSIEEKVTGLFYDSTSKDLFKKLMFYYKNRDIALLHGSNGRLRIKKMYNSIDIWKDFEKKILNSSIN